MPLRAAKGIASRIVNLRDTLGLNQRELARRAGVRHKQITAWIQGRQTPTETRLESWAEREGWPVEIFAEDGPMPSEVIGDRRLRSGDSPVTHGEQMLEPPDRRGITMIAQQVARCIQQTLDSNELPYSQAARESVAHALYAFASELRRDGADVSDLTLLALNLMGAKGP